MKTEKQKDIYQDAEFVTQMVQRYLDAGREDSDQEARDAVVQELSDETGKSTKSIIQKLHREGVYIAKKVAKGAKTPTKSELADKFVEVMGLDMTESEVTSLEKPTKQALLKMVAQAEKLQAQITMLTEAED